MHGSGSLAHTQPWLEVKRLPPKLGLILTPIRIPGSLRARVLRLLNWGQGGRPVPLLLRPSLPGNILAEEEASRRGWEACLQL